MKATHELHITVDHPTPFDVREFRVREALHDLFEVELLVVSPDLHVDLDALVGTKACFGLQRADHMPSRSWHGIVTACEHVGIEDDQLGSYRLVIHPSLWLLTQRRNYRIFQQSSDPDSAQAVLAEWGIEPRRSYQAAQYPGRKYRVQYAESDYAFVRRLLEDAGITFFFEESDGDTRLVLSDAPHAAALRTTPILYENAPSGEVLREVATNVRVTRKLRPGRYTQRDVDYRRSPEFPLVASAASGEAVEAKLERFHQNYGAFLFAAEPDGSSPVADDHGAARTNLQVAERQVARRLAAKRSDAHRCLFTTTAHDLRPGVVFHFGAHPRPELAEGRRLLVVACELSGRSIGEWRHEVDATFADQPYHPPLRTTKPKTFGMESATVVGPEDDEIHTDEFARVRVQFHWDREGKRDTYASCWIPVSQPWGGAGFGAVNIPRVGQEVLVDFLGADPDRPVVVGRVFTKTNPVPYSLPRHKTVSGIRSQTANRMVMGAADGDGAGVFPAGPAAPSLMPMPGGLPMGPTRLNAALLDQHSKAVSPNQQAHRWPGSEVTMDDTLGSELLYIQAERDLNTVVKNNATTVFGNRRCVRVGTDDVLHVDNQQFIQTGSDRAVSVGATQTHVVNGNIYQESVAGSQEFVSEQGSFSSTSKTAVHYASESITLQVGGSTLFMAPDFVILQSDLLFLNPGLEATEVAMLTGVRPATPEEVAQAKHDADVAAARAELETQWQDGNLRHSGDLGQYATTYYHPLNQYPDDVRRQAMMDFERAHAVGVDPDLLGTGMYYPYDTYTPPPTFGPQ
ncbi:MAG: type VI secretion system tip protein VgrG [Myxococcales bacterium]|nr:type VI secretion system tip protein VgrG [Myxococcales bacterium]